MQTIWFRIQDSGMEEISLTNFVHFLIDSKIPFSVEYDSGSVGVSGHRMEEIHFAYLHS